MGHSMYRKSNYKKLTILGLNRCKNNNITSFTHMGTVDIDDLISIFDAAETNSFTPKPVPMVYLVDVSIQRPLVEEHILDLPF